MRKLLIGLLCLWVTAVQGQVISDDGVINSSTTSTSYQGPGDVISNSYIGWSVRAWTSAKRGTKVLTACDSTGGTDVACADMLSDATTGDLVAQTIGGVSCPSNANCTIKTIYDQAGANCIGSVACDVEQTTVANRATFAVNVTGGKTCLTGGTSYGIVGGNVIIGGTSQPQSSTLVMQRISGTSSAGINISSGLVYSFSVSGIANQWQLGSNTQQTFTANDASFHDLQAVYNDASSSALLDGSSVALGGATGTFGFLASTAAALTLGSGHYWCEGGWWVGDKSASFSLLHSNQTSYFGVP